MYHNYLQKPIEFSGSFFFFCNNYGKHFWYFLLLTHIPNLRYSKYQFVRYILFQLSWIF